MINWNKPIETVDGEPARVISTDYTGYDGSNSYIVQIEGKHFARLGFFKEDGKPHGSCDRISNVRVKREGWVLVRPHGEEMERRYLANDNVYASEAEAELSKKRWYGADPRIKTVHLTWEE